MNKSSLLITADVVENRKCFFLPQKKDKRGPTPPPLRILKQRAMRFLEANISFRT